MNLSLYEQETVINYNEEEATAKAINALLCFCVSVTTAFLSVIFEKSREFTGIAVVPCFGKGVAGLATPSAPLPLPKPWWCASWPPSGPV